MHILEWKTNEIKRLNKEVKQLIYDLAAMEIERDKLKTNLAAALALLGEVREWIPYYRWIPDLRERVDAIIGKKTP